MATMPRMRFCPRCGTALEAWNDGGTMRGWCPGCGYVAYQNAKPTAGVLITRGRFVLLGQRAIEPYRGWWDIIGGFLEAGEHPEDGARREAREETGLDVTLGPLLSIGMGRYNDEDWTLNIYYIAYAPLGEPQANDDVAALRWFEADVLPDAIAFPQPQRQVLEDWRRWLNARPTTPEGA